MPKKAVKKRKAAQAARCEAHRQGRLNDTNGNWVGSNAIRASIWQMSMSGALHKKV